MKITTNSPQFKETFGPYPSLTELSLAKFDSQGPTFSLIKNAFTDETNANIFSDTDNLNGVQSQDVRNGLRLFMRDLAVSLETDAGQPKISINCPTSLLVNGLQQVVNSAEIGPVLSSQTVYTIFNGVVSGDPKKVGVALIGVGMTAVGVAVPVVGWIGAAITIVASAVSAAFNRAKAKKAADDASAGPATLAGSRGHESLRPIARGPTIAPARRPGRHSMRIHPREAAGVLV